MQRRLLFKTITQAIEEAHRWDQESGFTALVTLEKGGGYTLYGHGKCVYSTAHINDAGGELEVYRRQ